MPLFCLYTLSGVTYETKANFTLHCPLIISQFSYGIILFLNLLRVPLLRSLMYLQYIILYFSCEKDEAESQAFYLNIFKLSCLIVTNSLLGLATVWALAKRASEGDSVWMILLMQYSNILISQSFLPKQYDHFEDSHIQSAVYTESFLHILWRFSC